MRINNRNDRNGWYNTIPVQGASARRWPNPDTFDVNKLQENEIDYGNGTVLAKIPVIPNHIYKRREKDRSKVYIELVLGRSYDEASKQTRNRKVIIGTDAAGLFDGMMVINEKYREYFDKDGRIINEELKRTLAKEAREKEKKKQKSEAAKREKQKIAMGKKLLEGPEKIDFDSLTDNEWQALGDVLEEVMTPGEPEGLETAEAKGEKSQSGIVRGTETEEGQSGTARRNKGNQNGTIRKDLTKAAEAKKQDKTAKKEEKRTVEEIQQSIEEKEKELTQKLEEVERLRKEMEHIQTVKQFQYEEAVRNHMRLLADYFTTHYSDVREQSKRHASMPMTPKAVRTVNELLVQFQKYFKGSEAEEFLRLAEEPVVNKDGEIVGGTTYGEMALLMNYYHWTIASFERGVLNEKFDMPKNE